jgi:hypothetical protein
MRTKLFVLTALFALCALAADVTGTWKGSMETPNGSRDVTLNLKADGSALTGTISGRQGDTPIQDGKVSGDNVSFHVVRRFNDQEFKMEYKGKVQGDELNLDVNVGERNFQMKMKRQ